LQTHWIAGNETSPNNYCWYPKVDFNTALSNENMAENYFALSQCMRLTNGPIQQQSRGNKRKLK